MLRLARDEHIDRALIRGLLSRQPNLDILRVQEAWCVPRGRSIAAGESH